ncbi:MAG TPA: hypothetical protein VN867_07865 [Candidatus Binataceae bacterium]|jgi:hypothetical protein|nr:hypothetical protein [Candidatus Binataceae bacterium]
MAPFFSGMAIGIAILIPLVILIFAIRFLLLIGAFFYGFARAAHASWVKAHPPKNPMRADSMTCSGPK